MDRQNAEKIITEYLNPIFGFALKRCKNAHDAEDLSQDIVLRAFRALLTKDDIGDIGKFIWTIAHNALNNYYRDTAKGVIGVSIDDVANISYNGDWSFVGDDDTYESVRCLQSEIAYLSRLQRKIVIAYYFENRKQADIAKELDIPLGTVKWHLFEAKKELKRGMDTMRKTSELKFNPIKFHSYGINGSIGTKSTDEFFRSALSQNICYCVRNQAKTVNEIADALGVSPVYVETEVDFLEEYGFLKEENKKYIVNFIISEPTAELLTMQDAMYKKAAGLFANELYDRLIASRLLAHPDIWCGQTDRPITLTSASKADANFVLWSLIPYIAAESGAGMVDDRISFDEVATVRPDGAHNICNATVIPENTVLPEDYVYMRNWCGPFRYASKKYSSKNTMFWQLDTEWSERRMSVGKGDSERVERVLSLYRSEDDGCLAKDKYIWLSELGYIKTNGEYDGYFKCSWQPVILASEDIKNQLLAIGKKIKLKYKNEFDAIKEPYVQAMLDAVPRHLRKLKEYELQFTFHSDGWFLLHCIVALLNNGKLKPPTDQQRKMLSTLILQNE